MTGYSRGVWLLAMSLSALAGFVDALGFIALGGFFISFMSGNSTRASVALTLGSEEAWLAFELIACFVLGVIGGALVAARFNNRARGVVLGFVAALLCLAAVLHGFGMSKAAIFVMTLAMGAENSVFLRNGEVSIGLTYMTGTLVKMGQKIAQAAVGGSRYEWLPYLMLWVGLMAGAIAGAALYPRLGLNALWIAAVWAAVLAVIAARSEGD